MVLRAKFALKKMEQWRLEREEAQKQEQRHQKEQRNIGGDNSSDPFKFAKTPDTPVNKKNPTTHNNNKSVAFKQDHPLPHPQHALTPSPRHYNGIRLPKLSPNSVHAQTPQPHHTTTTSGRDDDGLSPRDRKEKIVRKLKKMDLERRRSTRVIGGGSDDEETNVNSKTLIPGLLPFGYKKPDPTDDDFLAASERLMSPKRKSVYELQLVKSKLLGKNGRRKSNATNQFKSTNPRVRRALGLLRTMVHVVGLGMQTMHKSRGGQGTAKFTVSKDYSMDPQVFDVRHYMKTSDVFGFFQVQRRESEYTFALKEHVVHKWVISMVSPIDAKSLSELFSKTNHHENNNNNDKNQSSNTFDDGASNNNNNNNNNTNHSLMFITCMWSAQDQKIVVRSIRELTPTDKEYTVVSDFSRLVRSYTDPSDLDIDYVDQAEGDDENDNIGIDKEIPMPTRRDLRNLPREFQSTIDSIAARTLREVFYPITLLAVRKRNRSLATDQSRPSAPPMTISRLKGYAMFRRWPDDILLDLLNSIQFITYEADELVLHEDENVGSGIYILVRGNIVPVKKIDSKVKHCGASNATELPERQAPQIFGEFDFLTEEPRQESIKCAQRCDFYVIRKLDFNRTFCRLPKSLLSSVFDVAFEKRKVAMQLAFPVTREFLRSFKIFSVCTPDSLDRIRTKCMAMSVPKRHVLFNAGDDASELYFLCNGKVGIYREDVHIKTIQPGSVIGEAFVMYSCAHEETARTHTNCDLWRISKQELDIIISSVPGEFNLILQEIQATRQGELNAQQTKFREYIDEIPIISSILPRGALHPLYDKFATKIYKPNFLLASTAHFADRLIILTKGSVRVGDGGLFRVGECIGYSCVVPHRWSTSVSTLSIVEVLEMKMEDYEAFLHKQNIHAEVVKTCQLLMFPRAASDDALVAKAWKMLPKGLVTPPVFPVSYSRHINLHEYRFGVLSPTQGAVCGIENTRPMVKSEVKQTKTSLERSRLTAKDPDSIPVERRAKRLSRKPQIR